MQVKLSVNPNLLPRPLLWPIKALTATGRVELWRQTRERALFQVLRWQQFMRNGSLSRSFTAQDISASSFCNSRYPVLPPLPWRLELDDQQIETLLNGELTIFGHRWQWEASGSCWHKAPDTGRHWPREFFAHIPINEGNSNGDIRVTWEPSRLQHLVTLALLAQKAEPAIRDRTVALCESQLCSWSDANPFLIGVHYISLMECALRLLAVCYSTDLIRPWIRAPERVWTSLLGLVFNHAELIRKRLPVHGSTSHETLAAAAALVHAGNLFHELEPAERWSALGLYLLEQETPRHISHDGGSIEQGFGYLQFSTDLHGLVVALLDHRQCPVPEKIRGAFDRSRDFLDEFRNVSDGTLPRIGDGDDGSALSPYLCFPGTGKKRRAGLTTFHLAGYSIIRGRNLQRAIFDHGPLGMGPSYAHGHADALALLFHLGSHEVLVDPGTYTYTGDGQWRRYFRGTRAHNTVTVDGTDQAVQEGPLSWSNPFESQLVYRDETPEGKITVIARHYGYKARLGVTHLRGVSYEPPGSWIIWDWLTGSGIHHLELNWHLGCRPTVVERGYELSGLDVPLLLTVEGGSVSLHEGEVQPIMGWRSPTYGVKEPLTTLRVEHTGSLPHEFMTRLRIGES
ncbi:MAG TPA: heparinase II/III-family protein [Nitrospiraceae bacterium]|nr:heparinase II/III-family protein [Nitrospiraceae bacterium]